MRLAENVLVALKRLKHRPVRSLLLLQGTIWGVAVALFPPAVMDGTREAALRRGPEIGADRIAVAVDPAAVGAKPLDASDVPAVREALAALGIPVTAAAGMRVEKGVPVLSTAGARAADVVHATPGAPEARGLALAQGRLPSPDPAAGEAVVEGLLADEIRAARGRVLGEALDLGAGRRATVVGALATRTPLSRRTNDMGFDVGHPVFRGGVGALLIALGVPWGDDAWKRTDRCVYVAADDPRVDWMYVRVPAVDTRRAKDAIEAALFARGKPPLVFYPPYYPLLISDELDRFKTMSLALFLACLVMGGVVMANVGLLAAIRRAPEVAVHRVEGARRRDVAAQFLTEGAVLSLLGTAVGFALACGLAELRVAIEPTSGYAWRFPWPQAGVAAAVALLVGVLSLALPALRAARQDPVEALVDE